MTRRIRRADILAIRREVYGVPITLAGIEFAQLPSMVRERRAAELADLASARIAAEQRSQDFSEKIRKALARTTASV